MNERDHELTDAELDATCGGAGATINVLSYCNLIGAAKNAQDDLKTIMGYAKSIDLQKGILRTTISLTNQLTAK